MNSPRAAALAALVVLCAPAAWAQSLDVPVTVMESDGQAAVCASDRVSGLDPKGDGFLAVRTGPGTRFRKIDELRNGDVVATCERRGAWHGVFYRPRGTGPGPATRQGWVHGNWLTPLAG